MAGQDADQKKLGGREVSFTNIINNVKYLFFGDHGLNGADIVVDEGITIHGAREGYQ